MEKKQRDCDCGCAAGAAAHYFDRPFGRLSYVTIVWFSHLASHSSSHSRVSFYLYLVIDDMGGGKCYFIQRVILKRTQNTWSVHLYHTAYTKMALIFKIVKVPKLLKSSIQNVPLNELKFWWKIRPSRPTLPRVYPNMTSFCTENLRIVWEKNGNVFC